MWKRLGLAFLTVTLLGTAWGWYQWHDIMRLWHETEPVRTDAAIVLGAAVWSGRPSPALRERLDVAAEIYRQGLTPRIICTGGVGSLDPRSEASVCAEYLRERGVPQDRILVEDRSTDTWENLQNSRQIMDREGLKTALIVTHGFHLKRALLQAKAIGLDAYGAPVKTMVLNLPYFMLREIAALAYHAIGGR